MQPDNPITLESHALSTLSYIRTSMDSASLLVVPGSAGLAMGAVGVVASVAANSPYLQPHWLATWLLAACVAIALGAGLMVQQAKRNGRTLYRGPARKFLLCLCPALVAGAVLTLALSRGDLTRYLPGVWLLSYGSAVLAASAMTSATTLRLIVSMGSIFMLFGIVAIESPTSTHNLILGGGFGGLHLLFGILIGQANIGRASHGE